MKGFKSYKSDTPISDDISSRVISTMYPQITDDEQEFTIKKLNEFSKTLKKIIAYSESNPSIGLGHLARTCQVLSCLNKKYFEIDFFCDYEETPDWISKIDHNKIDIDNF